MCSATGPAGIFIGKACAPLTEAGSPFAPFKVTIRIDDAPATEATMRINLFAPELIGDSSVAHQDSDPQTSDFGSFIEGYLDSHQMAIRYVTAEGGLETLVFQTEGMRETAFSPQSMCDAGMF